MHDKCRTRSDENPRTEIDGKTTTMEFHSYSKERKKKSFSVLKNEKQTSAIYTSVTLLNCSREEERRKARARERERRENLLLFFIMLSCLFSDIE